MKKTGANVQRYVDAISSSGLTIYDPIEIGDPTLWVPAGDLEAILAVSLAHISLKGLPLRSRSKLVKTLVSRALGYPVPPVFRKTRPRFPGQCFDTYVQKSNNLQVWNEDLEPTRRYVIIRVTSDDVIAQVKVVDGTSLALLDTTGTLTQKYQASVVAGPEPAELISLTDTRRVAGLVKMAQKATLWGVSPIAYPDSETLLPIDQLFSRLKDLVGSVFKDSGFDQERNRGGALHQLVCHSLGYLNYADDGRFPDVKNQLLEIKLQTSRTIDLGLVRPNSEEGLDIPKVAGRAIRHCDVRYAVFCARTDGSTVTLTHIYVSTGQDFFKRFTQFQGKVLNKKLQIPLPRNFFGS